MSESSQSANTPQSGPAKRRKEGARSKTGCGTCRGRRKKCDEHFVDGACERCAKGGFLCVAESLRPSRSKRLLQPNGAGVSSPSTSSRAHQPQQSPATSQTSQGCFVTTSVSTASSVPPVLHSPATPQIGTEGGQMDPHSYTYPLTFPLTGYDTDLLSLLGAVDSQASGLDSLPPLLEPYSPINSLNTVSAGPSTNTAFSQQVPGMADVSPAHTASTPALETPTTESVMQDTIREMRTFADHWWEFYNSLNTSYFFSIPKQARDIVNAGMRELMMGRGSNLMRGAVSSWCSSHYATVLLKERSSQYEEWEEKAGIYYQQTLAMLFHSTSSLVEKIGAVLDLRMAQVNRHGAAPAYFLLLAGEAWIKEELGMTPKFDFGKRTGIEDFAPRIYIYADVFRSVCTRGRRTLFELENSFSPETHVCDVASVNARSISVHLGLPVELLLLMAEAINLAAMFMVDSAADDRNRLGEDLIRRIDAWKPDVQLALESGIEHAAYLNDLATQELWRQAVLIYVNSTVLELGPLATPLREAIAQVVKLASTLTDPPPDSPSIFTDMARSAIWFLAGTVALTADERDVCREGLEACGPGRAFVDNTKVMEKLWSEVDATGIVRDWRLIAEEIGIAVCFT